MALRLADLECTSATLNAWSPLREHVSATVELWEMNLLHEPPPEVEELSWHLIDMHRVKSDELYLHFWADREDPDPWPFRHYCILGHVTAFYVLAWAASMRGDRTQAETYLIEGNSMLRMDDHDLFEHTSWPFTSFDLLSNLFFLRRDWPFQAKHLKPELGQWIQQRLPLMWPPYSPPCWPRCPGTTATAGKIPLKVWWTSKNPGPFVDFATILENWMSDRYEIEVSHNALADHCVYARYKDWLCSKDARFREVMEEERIMKHISQADCGETRGQWCGLRELHEDFDVKVLHFQSLFPELKEVDLFACGHPLYWCRLVAGLGAPILGIWDMTHHFGVPDDLQESWTSEFLDLFQDRRNLLVAMSAYHSFQIRWLLGLHVPYFQPVTPDVSLQARYSPRPNQVLVSKFQTPYDVELLHRFANEAMSHEAGFPHFPFHFIAWDDMPCGNDCSKAELGQFRASVLSAYDTSPMKLTEFYAMSIPICIFSGGLWRTAMRWAKADAKSGGPNATRPGREFREFLAVELEVEEPPSPSWIRKALMKETENIDWEQPWHVHPGYREPFERSEPPFTDLPYSPFMPNRGELITPGAAFWAQLTDWALLPHLIRYESVPQLINILLTTSLEELLEISRQMASHYAKLLVASTNFWRALIMTLVEQDTSMWKAKDT